MPIKKFLLIILIGLILIGLLVHPLFAQSDAPQPQTGKIDLYFFHAQDCQPCQVILQGYLPSLKTIYPTLEVRAFDIGNPGYYAALSKLEARFGRSGSELPVVLVGDHLLSGEVEIMGKLDPLLLEYQLIGGVSLPPLAEDGSKKTFPSKRAPPAPTTVELTYFYQKGCPKCDRANALLAYLSKTYPGLKIREIDLNTPDGKRLNETLSNRLNLPPEKRLIAPSIFIGNEFFPPEEVTESNLKASLQKVAGVPPEAGTRDRERIPPPSLPSSPTLEETQKAEESIINRFQTFGVFTIVSAGLIDGVNPCAFATLIFFISYLTFVGRKRREILWVGIGFSGAVFTTYLLIGLGILSFIQHLSFLPLFSRIVYLITILIALFLGTLSVYDYLQLKRGRPSEMKLQLPDFLKKRIHQTIRQESRSSRYFLAAIVAGVVISILEFACTGQVYLPTILFVTNIPSLRNEAFFYLFLYNVMFVVPLLVIFGITYWGVTSEHLALFLNRHATTIKLLTALLFYLLAGVLVATLL